MAEGTAHHSLFPEEVIGRKKAEELRCQLKCFAVKSGAQADLLRPRPVILLELLDPILATGQANDMSLSNALLEILMQLKLTTVYVEARPCLESAAERFVTLHGVKRLHSRPCTQAKNTQDALIVAVPKGFAIGTDPLPLLSHNDFTLLRPLQGLFKDLLGRRMAGFECHDTTEDLVSSQLSLRHLQCCTEFLVTPVLINLSAVLKETDALQLCLCNELKRPTDNNRGSIHIPNRGSVKCSILDKISVDPEFPGLMLRLPEFCESWRSHCW